MFINESTNVTESAIFYGFMREALIEQVSGDEDMVSFIESASDTDIISFAVTGKAAPSDLDRSLYETALMSIIKENVIANPEIFSESESYGALDFIQEIGSLRYITSNDVLQELSGASTGKFLSKGKEFIDKAKDVGSDVVNKGRDIATKGASHAKYAKETVDKAGREAGEAISDKYEDVKDKLTGNNDKLHKAGKMAKRGIRDTKEAFGDWWNDAKHKVTSSDAWAKISRFTQDHGKQVGVAALVAAASFIAYKAYTNYFSKAAKACAGKSGAEKAACMAKAKGQANKARAAALKKGMSMSKNSVNPQKVRAALSNKLAKIQS